MAELGKAEKRSSARIVRNGRPLRAASAPRRLIDIDVRVHQRYGSPRVGRPSTNRTTRCTMLDDDDHFHDQCGVFGVFGSSEAANLTYLGLHALQHRGQESAGIAVANDGSPQRASRARPGARRVQRNRCCASSSATARSATCATRPPAAPHVKNAQPIAVDYALGSLAVAHNGNLTNYEELRAQLEGEGSIFQTTSDSEVLVHLIAHSRQRTHADRVADALRQVRGAFSLLFLTGEELIAVRDPYGFRPLSIGRFKDGGWVFASEPPAFDLIQADYVRDVEPGEMVVVIDRRAACESYLPVRRERAPHVHLRVRVLRAPRLHARRRQRVRSAQAPRPHARARSARSTPTWSSPCPTAASPRRSAIRRSPASRSSSGLIRSHYVGRTFIEPQSSIRHFGVRLKLSPVREVLEGKRVVVVDDSIVRGTTSRKIVKMLRDAGANEVHLRISAPPTRWPCFYGIDTPSRSELIASSHSDRRDRASTSPATRSATSASKACTQSISGKGYCDACFSGDYPVAFSKPGHQRRQLALIGV